MGRREITISRELQNRWQLGEPLDGVRFKMLDRVTVVRGRWDKLDAALAEMRTQLAPMFNGGGQCGEH